MKILNYKYLFPFFFLSSSMAQNSNFVSIDDYTPFNNKYMINTPNNTIVEETKSAFDIKSISSMYINDITNPKIIDNSNEFNFDTSPECLNLVKSKYSCVKLQSKNFNSFCERLNSTACSLLSDYDRTKISETCKISLLEAGEFVNTINKLINSKKFFCVKINDEKENSSETNIKDKSVEKDEKNDTESCKEDEKDGYCPITISLQNGYLKLIKEIEDQEMNIHKRKRSPVISNINSFLPSRNIDAQIIKKRLVEDLKKNCNFTICRGKLNEYLKGIKDDFSYFNVIYQYKVNDDTLRDNILEILKENNCSGISMRVTLSSKILLTIVGVIIYLLL
ncbi:hypothetical protein PIROE2DRAFT_68582 [Piromyces sp. E2]|nr:hypothetical protein PIROE2DRAFT_68582 [Piromyces sp. E2]|eukprot:OUM69169.1 hypothetical protein PIROE2DRAFT_68582 [Piromyces sp. E2]